MQQKSNKLSFGPGAASIILIVVILSMSILGLRAYMMTRNDLSLSDRSARVTEEVYELNARAERSLAALDAISAGILESAESDEAYLEQLKEKLPEGMTLEDDTVVWQESEGTHSLNLSAALPVGTKDGHITWKTHRHIVEMEMNFDNMGMNMGMNMEMGSVWN